MLSDEAVEGGGDEALDRVVVAEPLEALFRRRDLLGVGLGEQAKVRVSAVDSFTLAHSHSIDTPRSSLGLSPAPTQNEGRRAGVASG